MFVGWVKTSVCSWVDSFIRKSYWDSGRQCQSISLHRPLGYMVGLWVAMQKANWTLTCDMTWTGFLSPELLFKDLCSVLWYTWKGTKSEQQGLQICCTESCTELLGTSGGALTDWSDTALPWQARSQEWMRMIISPSPSHCLHHHVKCGHFSRKGLIRAQLKLLRPAIILASLSLKSFSLQAVGLHCSKLRQHTE